MADRISDQRLAAQDEEIPRQGTGHGDEDARQHRHQGQGDKFGTVHAITPPRMSMRLSISRIWSAVSTVSMGVRPSYCWAAAS